MSPSRTKEVVYLERSFWQRIVTDQFAIPEGYTAQQLLPELLSYLGSSDPELRDEIGYFTFDHWIQAGHFTPEQLIDVAEQLLPNLDDRLGDIGTDSVFLRSFSTLILTQLIAYDKQVPYLAAAMVRRILDQAIAYLVGERDLRGYVAEKGWAHSVAHSADLLGALAQNRFIDSLELEQLMIAVADKLSAPALHRYDCDEDERLVNAVMTMVERNALSDEQLRAWIARLFDPPGRPAWGEAYRDEAALGARHNTKLFLMSLYFRLATAGGRTEAAPVLLQMLKAPLRSMVWA